MMPPAARTSPTSAFGKTCSSACTDAASWALPHAMRIDPGPVRRVCDTLDRLTQAQTGNMMHLVDSEEFCQAGTMTTLQQGPVRGVVVSAGHCW
jgi:hypothetical protein